MKTCPTCDRVYPDETRFCKVCGCALTSGISSVLPEQIVATGQVADSVEAYRHLLSSDPSNPRACLYVACADLEEQQPEDARVETSLALLRKALGRPEKLTPAERNRALAYVGLALARLGRTREAREELERLGERLREVQSVRDAPDPGHRKLIHSAIGN